MPSPTAGNSAVFTLFRYALGITNFSALRARRRCRGCWRGALVGLRGELVDHGGVDGVLALLRALDVAVLVAAFAEEVAFDALAVGATRGFQGIPG